jgi:hypothetical protein
MPDSEMCEYDGAIEQTEYGLEWRVDDEIHRLFLPFGKVHIISNIVRGEN